MDHGIITPWAAQYAQSWALYQTMHYLKNKLAFSSSNYVTIFLVWTYLWPIPRYALNIPTTNLVLYVGTGSKVKQPWDPKQEYTKQKVEQDKYSQPQCSQALQSPRQHITTKTQVESVHRGREINKRCKKVGVEQKQSPIDHTPGIKKNQKQQQWHHEDNVEASKRGGREVALHDVQCNNQVRDGE